MSNILANSQEDDENLKKYERLIEKKVLSKNYAEDGIQMQLSLEPMADTNWYIILSAVKNKEHSLRELQVDWNDMDMGDSDEKAKGRFIELIKALGTDTTSVKLMFSVSWNQKLAFTLGVLKGTSFIKHLSTESKGIDLDAASALTELLMNNQTLVSLDLHFEVYREGGDHGEGYLNCPVSTETLLELAHSFASSFLQRLKIYQIDNKGFEILAKSLPKTLIHLDLSENRINEESIPILHSYLTSNGKTLQELILDDQLATQYLQQYKSSTVKIMPNTSWEAILSRKKRSLTVEMNKLDDNGWPLLMTELNKKETTIREISLFPDRELNQNDINYLQTLLGEQCQLTSLVLTNYYSNKSMGIEILPMLNKNNSIRKLEISSTTSKMLAELLNVLKTNNNIAYLNLRSCSYLSDDEVIMLANYFKNLQSLVMINSQMSDKAFQTLLSCLSDSLCQLELEETQITEQSLPVLLDFINTHENLKQISLQQNGISTKNSSGINVSNLLGQVLELTNKKGCFLTLNIDDRMYDITAGSTDNTVSLYPRNLRGHHIGRLYNEMKKTPDMVLFLDITHNEQISPIGYRHLANILSSTIRIVNLGIRGNNLDEEERRNFLNGLQKNKTLENFNIWTKLNSQDMESIGRFIQNNPGLKDLDLYECDIGDDGVIPLIKVLPTSHLTSLQLSENSLGDSSCASLLACIPSTLKKLSLMNNKITEASLKEILNFLTTNRTLEILELKYNPIFENDDSDENVYRQQINEAAKQNGICQVT